jgi:polyvinyl alcohol dehydrogenase (cytochrome)
MRRISSLILLFCAFTGFAFSAESDGATLFATRCASCHWDTAPQRVPSRGDLAKLNPEQVVNELTRGRMVNQAIGLSAEDLQQLALFVTGKSAALAPIDATAGTCSAINPSALATPFVPGPGDWNGWSARDDNTRFQPNPGLAAKDVPRLKLKWAFGFPGDLMNGAQPTIVGGRVFIGSARGTVYALDQSSGCILWRFDAGAMVRSAITIAAAPSGTNAKFMAYFGDLRSNAYGLNAETGEMIWTTKLDPHKSGRVTAPPVVHMGRVFFSMASLEEVDAMMPDYECCTFRGSLSALDTATGKVIWKSYSIPDPPKQYKTAANGLKLFGPAGAGIWNTPTIDMKRHRLYVGTGNSYTGQDVNTSDAILAFDMESGSLVWSRQVTPKDNWVPSCIADKNAPNCPENSGEDLDFGGGAPVMRKIGNKDVLIAGQKSGVVWALDPDQMGKVLWSTRVGAGGALGGIEFGSAYDDRTVYASISDVGNPKGKPGLYAIRIVDGKVQWSSPAPANAGDPAQPQAVTAIPGAVFEGSLGGHFRGYNALTGKILWDFDALGQAFETVNKVAAKGGSFNGGGAAVANGMVVVPSGYGMLRGTPGNVLLAFTVDGK